MATSASPTGAFWKDPSPMAMAATYHQPGRDRARMAAARASVAKNAAPVSSIAEVAYCQNWSELAQSSALVCHGEEKILWRLT